MTSPLGIPCADGTPAPPLPDSQSRLITLFDRTPDAAIKDRRLRHCDRTVLSSLGHFAMFSHPNVDATQREVAAHACMTEQWLRNCYRRLEATGYIARERHHRTHAPARITLLYDFPESAPNRNDPSAPKQTNTAPNRNARFGKTAPNRNARFGYVHAASLYRDLDKNKEREEYPPPLNCSNLPREHQPPPRVMRQIARDARETEYLAKPRAEIDAFYFGDTSNHQESQ